MGASRPMTALVFGEKPRVTGLFVIGSDGALYRKDEKPSFYAVGAPDTL